MGTQSYLPYTPFHHLHLSMVSVFQIGPRQIWTHDKLALVGLRVWAMWGRSRPSAIALTVLFLSYFIFCTTSAIIAFSHRRKLSFEMCLRSFAHHGSFTSCNIYLTANGRNLYQYLTKFVFSFILVDATHLTHAVCYAETSVTISTRWIKW